MEPSKSLTDYKWAFGKLKDKAGWAILRINPDKTIDQFGPWKLRREMDAAFQLGTFVDRPLN